MKKFLLTAACVLGFAMAANAATVTDVLTVENLNVAGSTSTSYAEFTVTGESGAEYFLQCAHNKATRLQFRSNNSNSGLVVTKSAGTVVSVTLTWEAETNTAGRSMSVYSSATAYTNATELYASGLTADGKLDLSEAKPNTYSFTNDTEYFGLRSTSGAVYLTKIEIVWETSATPATVAAPKISCEDNMVTITVEDGATAYYTTDESTPTTSSTPYSAPFAITANTTVKAIAAKGTDVSRVTTFNAKYVGTYAKYADLVAAGDATEGTVTGPITGIYKNGFNLYTVDADGGFMLLYDTGSFAGLTDFANGDTFAEVSGKYDAKYNELTNVTLGAKTAGTPVQPEVLTLEEISADMVNKYVKIENVTIADGERENNYNMTDATGSIVLYNTFYNADRYTVVTVPVGEGFNVTGFVGVYNGTPQITPILVEGGQVMEAVATPTFSVASGAVTAGTTVEITTTTPGAAIFYTTDGTEPGASSTEYTGAITINEAMTIKAIALKEGMLDSNVATASYTILDPTASAASFDFTNPASLTPAVTAPTAEAQETDMSNMTLTSEAVSLTFSGKESGSALPRLWFNANSGIDLRVYKSQYFTVSVAEGFILTGIDFTHYATGKLAGLDCGQTGTYTVNADDTKKATWTAPDEAVQKVSSVTFNVTATSQATTMTVTYKKGESGVGNIAVEDENAPAEYYNLQGVRVNNPAPGSLYIVRRGTTVSKTLLR